MKIQPMKGDIMARSSEQNEKIREERKEQILSGALDLFANKGLFATKIKDIAEKVGIAQGLVYHYFKSKDDIYVELISNALDKTNEAVFSLQKMAVPPDEKIKVAIKELYWTIESSSDYTQTSRLIAHATNTTAIPEEAKRIIEEKRDLPYQEISKIMAEGQKEGAIIDGDPEELSILFWTSISGLAIYKATRQDKILMPDPEILTGMFLKKGYENAENQSIFG